MSAPSFACGSFAAWRSRCPASPGDRVEGRLRASCRLTSILRVAPRCTACAHEARTVSKSTRATYVQHAIYALPTVVIMRAVSRSQSLRFNVVTPKVVLTQAARVNTWPKRGVDTCVNTWLRGGVDTVLTQSSHGR